MEIQSSTNANTSSTFRFGKMPPSHDLKSSSVVPLSTSFVIAAISWLIWPAMIGDEHEDDAGEEREHAQDRDQHRSPAGELAPFEERDRRFETEAEEQGGADVQQDRREGLDAADQQQPHADAERRDERDAEWVVHLHGVS